MMILKIVHKIVYVGIVCGLIGAGFLVGFFKYYTIDFSSLEHRNIQSPTKVYDDCGELFCSFSYHKSDPVEFEAIPEHVIQAFLAAEDWHFFDHYGISFRGIVRSALVNLYKRRAVQGASTITQQLLKLVYFSHKKTFSRKIKEQLYAILVERHYTKEYIFQVYLNNVYFGCGIYGIKAAARAFFGIDVAQLSYDQAALLAGVIRSPGNYCPLLFPLSSKQRRNVVLGQMKKLHFITPEHYDSLVELPVETVQSSHDEFPYVKEYVRSFLEERFEKDEIYAGGLHVFITCNKSMQKDAEKLFNQHILDLRKKLKKNCNGGFISCEVATGAIKAMVGGASFCESQFNRALYAKRQQGSVFKPILYACAYQEGIDLFSLVTDEPLSVEHNGVVWEPRNYHNRYEGSMTIARGLVHSLNTIAVKLILTVGPEKVKKLAEKFHLTGPIFPYLSLALGCVDSTLLEVLGEFNVFANNGIYVEPYFIETIKDKDGKIVYKHVQNQERVLPQKTAHVIARILSCGAERKKRSSKYWIDSDACTKTGTTNDSRTCWFVGSTPEITTAVYVGNDDNTSLGSMVFPVQTAYPIWLDFHRTLTTVKKQFAYDPQLQFISVNLKTGKCAPVHSDPEVFLLAY